MHQLDEKKRERKKANATLKTIKDHYQPIKEKHKVEERAVERYKATAQDSMKAVRRMETQLRDKGEQLSALEDKVAEPRQELESAKRAEAARKAKIETLQREIEVSPYVAVLFLLPSPPSSSLLLPFPPSSCPPLPFLPLACLLPPSPYLSVPPLRVSRKT